MPILTILIIVAVLIALYLISTYNFFQTARTRIKASIQEIGNQLKRQADLIPNLESSVKGYLKHEKGILTALADARKKVAQAVKSGSLEKQAEAAGALSQVLPSLSVAVEDNPELKGSETVSKLMEELRDTSDKLMYARRTLIDLTADYNIKLVTVPSNIVGNIFGFKEEAGLKVADMSSATSVKTSETKTPKIKLN